MQNPGTLAKKAQKGILHVGANVAEERAAYGKNINVLWVEAIPASYDELLENIKVYPNQEALNVLISDVDKETKKFYVSNQPDRSSMYDFTAHHYKTKTFKHESTPEYEARRLDKLIDEGLIDISKYDILVTDCQGGDYNVVSSLGDYIRNFRFIKSEVMVKPIYKGMPMEKKLNEYLSENGFKRITNLSYVIRGSQRDNVYKRI